MTPVGVGVSQHHGERLVPTDLLNGGQIDTRLHQVGDGRMAHHVGRCFLGIESSTDDGPLEWPAQMGAVSQATEAGSLREELADAVTNLPPATIDRLRSFGIPESVILGEPLMIGVAEAETSPSGLYEPNDDGESILVVAEGCPAAPIWDTLDDLIAFKPQEPGRWWRRCGEAKILGAYNVRSEPVFPLTIHETPLSWLRSGARGICIVDWSFDPERLLYAGPLEVESDRLKARLERRIQKAALGKFEIVTPKEICNAA